MSEKNFLAGYEILKIPIEKNGEPAWPERFDRERIESLRVRVGEQKFLAQMMLLPPNKTGAMFDAAALCFYAEELVATEANNAISFAIGRARIVSQSCWWDPSYASEGGDFSVIASVMNDDGGGRFVHDVLYLARSEDEGGSCARQCAEVVKFLARNRTPRVAVEANGIGKFLPEILREHIARAGIECAVVPKNSKANKAVRIADAFDAAIASGRVMFAERLKDTPFWAEFLEWEPGGKSHDDGMDAVAGAMGEAGALMPSRVRISTATQKKKIFRIRRAEG